MGQNPGLEEYSHRLITSSTEKIQASDGWIDSNDPGIDSADRHKKQEDFVHANSWRSPLPLSVEKRSKQVVERAERIEVKCRAEQYAEITYFIVKLVRLEWYKEYGYNERAFPCWCGSNVTYKRG